MEKLKHHAFLDLLPFTSERDATPFSLCFSRLGASPNCGSLIFIQRLGGLIGVFHGRIYMTLYLNLRREEV